MLSHPSALLSLSSNRNVSWNKNCRDWHSHLVESIIINGTNDSLLIFTFHRKTSSRLVSNTLKIRINNLIETLLQRTILYTFVLICVLFGRNVLSNIWYNSLCAFSIISLYFLMFILFIVISLSNLWIVVFLNAYPGVVDLDSLGPQRLTVM